MGDTFVVAGDRVGRFVARRGWMILSYNHRASTCARVASVSGSQNIISMARYSSMAVKNLGASLVRLAGGGIQRAEAPVAVALERPHAQCVREGEGLPVVDFGRLDLWDRLARRALAQEPQRPCLPATLLVLARELDRLRSAQARVFQAARQQIRLAEAGDHERQSPRCAPGNHSLHPLFR